ncbi:hypothetical protein D0T92_01220 [Neisseria zalophi]|uniref:Uncharacterized protein n=1 Tax=Neisseria zalophi TaxID=640030 RepID=A0A5J6PS29_9NEIS|nr:hypothetical protein D0T92_01220 [Neisseria zalophi]
MLITFIIIFVGLGYWFFLMYVNSRVQGFLDELYKYPELYKKAGKPSDTYFFWEFIRLKYKFAIFLYKNKEVPPPLQFDSKEYNSIRFLVKLSLFLEWTRGLVIILVLILSQLLYSYN